MSDIYYIDTPATVQDRIRSFASDLAITCINKLDVLARWEFLDELRWWMEDILGDLFSVWFSESREQLFQFVNGEMPLEHIDEWVKSQIIGYDETDCSCIGCGGLFWTCDADETGCCPDCGEDLYLGDQWKDWKQNRELEGLPSLAPQPLLLLTERRAA